MALSLLAQQPAALTLPRALLFGVALVVELLAARQGEFDLGAASFVEIELERNKRHALALDRPDQFVDLPAMKQKLARPLWRMVEPVCLQVLGNVGIDQPDFAVASVGIGFGDRRLAETQRFHFGAVERETGLHRVVDEIVEARLAIVGDDAQFPLTLLSHSLALPSPRLPRVADLGQQLHLP